MTGLGRGEAARGYKGRMPYTPGVLQCVQVRASRKNLCKKKMTPKPKGKALPQENEVYFRNKQKETTITLGFTHTLSGKEYMAAE